MKRSPEWVSALLGCWIIGKAPIILDPGWPQKRRDQIIEEADITTFVSGPPTSPPSHISPSKIDLESPAYIIYSSGSTGKPKGGIVPHAGLTTMLDQQINLFEIGPQTRSLWLHGVAFDASISDIGTALLSRATLCIDPNAMEGTSDSFLNRVAHHRISHIDIPPALLAHLNPNNAPQCLKSLVIGGSVCAPEVVQKWAKVVHLVNVYGPTEATVCTSMVKCQHDWKQPLIGSPIDGISYLIHDENGDESVEGELIISGDGVALGYLKQQKLTSDRFFTLNNHRAFRTGDHVRKNEDGEIVFLGRIDRQFKKDGRLICPEEIEASLRALENITDAHVSLVDGLITTWFTSNSPADPKSLRSDLTTRLPEWMIPSRWIPMDNFPKLSNGKTDTREIEHHKPAPSPSPLYPDRLGILTQLARDVLEISSFSCDDDFFQAGGDSLATMCFLTAAANKGIELTPDCLYQHRTIRSLNEHIDNPVGYERSGEELISKLDSLPPPVKDNGTPLLSSQAEPHILITGATGFLGSAILGELLSRTNYEVTCLTRGDLSVRTQDILDNLKNHGFSPERKFNLVHGDLKDSKLGMHLNDWDRLTKSCSHIIHCGASTHSLATYDALKAINVDGTQHVLQFQFSGCDKQLFHISTLSVFVDATPLPSICQESDQLGITSTIYGGYAQSKWVAEKLVQRDSPASKVLRLGLLTSNQKTGFASREDGFTRKLMGLDPFPCESLLSENSTCDFTPVDYSARTIVDILINQPADQTFHIANPKQLSASQLYRAIKDSPFDLHLSKRKNDSSINHHTSDLLKTSSTRFSTSNTEKIQSSSCPEPTPQYLVESLSKMHKFLNDSQ